MANIFLTGKCNLKCPYCFADEFVNKANEEITIENFNKALGFIKTSADARIGLIGGEPALHSEFKTILNILNSDESIKFYVIFTNGLEIDKYIDYFDKKTNMLINCNSPDDIGGLRYSKLKENIKLLKTAEKNFSLGINLYSDKMDFSYIFELLKSIGHHHVRFSTALPNTAKENTDDPLESFKIFKPFLFKFFSGCLKNEIVPKSDCNGIPNCLLSADDKRLLLQFEILAEKNKAVEKDSTGTISTVHTCSPVIDIMPDLQAVRCFGLSNHLKTSIENFKNIESLRKYFYNKIDVYANVAYEKNECENCRSRLLDKCGLCYTYKIKKCEKIKEFVRSA